MEYLYCKNDNFQDFASGRVLYGGKGIPNFPIRLLLEIYSRALSYLNKEEDLVIYDPCCGGGYALTILGYYQNRYISKIYGSDIDEDMVAHAKKNTSLLTSAALKKRKTEIEELYNSFGKESHKEALGSCDKVSAMLEKEVIVEIFKLIVQCHCLIYCRILLLRMFHTGIWWNGNKEKIQLLIC